MSSQRYIITTHNTLPQCDYPLDSWFEFLRTCFAFKTTPPTKDYFKSHYYDDPYKGEDAQGDVYVLMKVGEDKEGENGCQVLTYTPNPKGTLIAPLLPPLHPSILQTLTYSSTLRIFHRTISGSKVFGLGEVCTKPDEGGMGLSTSLIEFMLGRVGGGTGDVVLHASDDFKGYYARLGWEEVGKLEYSVLEVEVEGVGMGDYGGIENNVGKGWDEHVSIYGSQVEVFGGVERNGEYFGSWFVNDCKRWGGRGSSGYGEVRVDGVLMGWVVIRIEEGREEGKVWQVRDACVREGGGMYFEGLVRYVMKREMVEGGDGGVWKVKVPEGFRAWGGLGDGKERVRAEADEGWMWRGSDGGVKDGFFIWPIDSF